MLEPTCLAAPVTSIASVWIGFIACSERNAPVSDLRCQGPLRRRPIPEAVLVRQTSERPGSDFSKHDLSPAVSMVGHHQRPCNEVDLVCLPPRDARTPGALPVSYGAK